MSPLEILADGDARLLEELRQASHELTSLLEERRAASAEERLQAAESAEPGRLFGTSGIRGRILPELSGNGLDPLVQHGEVPALLAYHLGLCLGEYLHGECLRGEGERRVYLARDVRSSGPLLAMLLCRGLLAAGIEVAYLGVTPTPSHVLYEPATVVVLTASHNPPDNNGIKVFRHGQPISRQLEELLEVQVASAAWLWERWRVPLVGDEEVHLLDARQAHRERLGAFLTEWATACGLLGERLPLAGRVLPLDLAHGAAACERPNWRLLPSPHLRLLLDLGVIVIGYALEQNGAGVNYRCGAAYLYGETEIAPSPEDVLAVAHGRGSFGAGQTRWLLFDPTKLGEVPAWLVAALAAGSPVTTEGDLPCVQLLPEVALDLPAEALLPALLVDGDADRLLCAALPLLDEDEPYLSGDLLLRVLLETSTSRELPLLLWTYESGLSIAKHLEHHNAHDTGAGYIASQVVNVGDRNLITKMLEAALPGAVGAEPSGHILLARPRADGAPGVVILDDPFAAYLLLLRHLAADDYRLDRVLHQLTAKVPQVPAMRKPDAYGPFGALAPGHKRVLEFSYLGEDGRRRVSPYGMGATGFLIETLLQAFRDLFSDRENPPGSPPSYRFTALWESVCEDGWLPDQDGDVQVAHGEGYEFRVRLTHEEALGPDVLYLQVDRPSAGGPVRVGEVVLRNSGTRPKNSGYVKLWPSVPGAESFPEEQLFLEVMRRVAVERVGFTDGCVLSLLAMGG